MAAPRTRRPHRAPPLLGARVDDPHLDTGEQSPHRTNRSPCRWSAGVRAAYAPRVSVWPKVLVKSTLGQGGHRPADQVHRGGRRAVAERLDRGQVGGLEAGVIEDAAEHGGDHESLRHPVPLHQVEPSPASNLGRRTVLARCSEMRRPRVPPMWKMGADIMSTCWGLGVDGLGVVGQPVGHHAVADGDGLRQPGGSTGEQDQSGVLLPSPVPRRR